MLTEDFVRSLHRRGVDVDALRIEPCMPKDNKNFIVQLYTLLDMFLQISECCHVQLQLPVLVKADNIKHTFRAKPS